MAPLGKCRLYGYCLSAFRHPHSRFYRSYQHLTAMAASLFWTQCWRGNGCNTLSGWPDDVAGAVIHEHLIHRQIKRPADAWFYECDQCGSAFPRHRNKNQGRYCHCLIRLAGVQNWQLSHTRRSRPETG